MPIEPALRVLFYIVVGFMLVIAMYWFGRSVYKSFFSTELVIAPFQVIGQKDDNEQFGTALAYMLQVRLRQIQVDLERSQKGLLPVPAADNPLANDPRVLAVPVPIIRSNENTSFSILNPPDINVSVGGVAVGGFFPWLQRTIVKERTLRFSVYREGDKAVIAGDLAPFVGADNSSLWIEMAKGTPDEIANSVAYELIHRKLSKDSNSQLRALESSEFRSLLAILFELAELNQKAIMGRAVKDRYADLLSRIEKIAFRVPEWSELITLTAKIAESADNNEKAIFYYKQSLELIKKKKSTPPPSETEIAKKIETLAGKTRIVPSNNNQAAFLEAVESYAKRIELPQPMPKISFVQPEVSGVLALWNEKKKQYEVNPDKIDTPGLPESSALGSWFLAKHYGRCFENGATPSGEVLFFWNDFRNSLMDYVISTEPDGSRMVGITKGFDWKFSRVLKEMEKNLQGDPQPVRKLALALLDQYDCDWTKANFLKNALAVNDELKIMPNKVIEDAVAAVLKD